MKNKDVFIKLRIIRRFWRILVFFDLNIFLFFKESCASLVVFCYCFELGMCSFLEFLMGFYKRLRVMVFFF